MTLAELLGRIARLTGRTPPRIRLPRWPIYPIAFAAEAMARVTKREPFVTVDGLADGRSTTCTSPRPRRNASLATDARPAEEGIRDAIDWFRQAGYLS